MIKFTVVESEWLHSEGNEVSCLLRSTDNKRCCLGFLAKDCGFSDEETIGHAALSELDKPIESLSLVKDGLGTSYLVNTSKAVDLMILNDKRLRDGFTYEEKKAQLKEQFAEIGYELTFVP